MTDSTSNDSGDEPLGDVATQVLFENEHVKVWEMVLEPGDSSALHHHKYEYFFVVLEGDAIDADFRKSLCTDNLPQASSGGRRTARSSG